MNGILTFDQSNDGKTLTITDASEWGESTNPSLTDITAVVITISPDGGTTSYTIVNEDSTDWAGATPIQSELEWEIDIDTDATFGASDSFNSDDAFIDDVYTITYTVTVGSGTFTATVFDVLLDYNVTYAVYNKFRQQPYKFVY